MSVLEPPEEPDKPTNNTDDLRDAVDWDSLGLDTAETIDVLPVTQLDSESLLSRYHQITLQLKDLGELLHPTTEEGRSLQSQRAALVVELHNRNLL
jgi:hypothetical protein